MAKKSSDKSIAEIKKEVEKGNVLIGTNETLKNIKLGKVKKVFVTSNCPVKEEIEHLCKIGKVESVHLDYPNDELGIICKKSFSISVLSFKGE